MKDKSKILTVINTGKRKVESEQAIQQIIRGGAGSGSPGGAYLLKSIWDKCWEIRKTDQGEEYLFGKLPVGLQFDLTSFVDAGLIDLPTLYDGLPIDYQTLYWEEIKEEAGTDEEGNPIYKTTKVLKAAGGGGTAEKVTWANIEGKPTWIGDSKPTYNYSEINSTPDLSKYLTSSSLNGYATEKWVGNNYLSLSGGTLSGDLILGGSSGGSPSIKFGDASYVYIQEDSDDHLKIYGSSGIAICVPDKGYDGKSYYIELVCNNGIKVNGGLLKYNSSSGYWEIEGDVLVTGGITSYE